MSSTDVAQDRNGVGLKDKKTGTQQSKCEKFPLHPVMKFIKVSKSTICF